MLDFLIDFDISSSMTTGTGSSSVSSTSSSPTSGELEYIPVALGIIMSVILSFGT